MTTLNATADYSDQLGFFDPDTFAETVVLIGLGGIGASLLPTLVTMGIRKIVIYDPDFVEERNMASQLLYSPADHYRHKAIVCEKYIRSMCPDAEVEAHVEEFTAEHTVPDGSLVIGAVDSMKARQTIWSVVSQSNAGLYLDGRIGGEQMTLLAVEPFDSEWYEDKWLFGDDKAVPLPCTQRAIVYPAVVLGALMCRHLAKWHKGEKLPDIVTFTLGDLFFQEAKAKR